MATAVGKVDGELKWTKATAAADRHGSVIEHRWDIIKTIKVSKVSWAADARPRV
jgi:hypothetical protein